MFVNHRILSLVFFYSTFNYATARYLQNVYVKMHTDLSSYEGECGDDRAAGVCKKISECFLPNGNLVDKYHHGLETCGHEGLIEIVCCPINSKSNERKSELACRTYAQDFPADVRDKILGGKNAKLGEFPHMAILGYKYQHSNELRWECGASLISLNFLLTAAHCVDRPDGILPTKVRLGTVNKYGRDKIKPQDMNIKSIVINHEYLPRLKRNDLALIELEFNVTKSEYVYPACLHQDMLDPANLTATGWGLTSINGNTSDLLLKVKLESVAVSNCSTFYQARTGRPILSTQICAKSSDGASDTCSGDSGGPLQIQEKPNSVYRIVGVTSYGIGCGGQRPGVYARVASYLNWIENIVWP